MVATEMTEIFTDEFLRTFSSEQEANAFKDGLEFFEQYVEVEDVFEDSEETWAVKFRRVA